MLAAALRNRQDSAYGRCLAARGASLRRMRNRQARPRGAFGGRSKQRFGLAQQVGLGLAATAMAAAAAGCASPGPPKPPSLNLPALATDIRAQRVGNQVLLSWTTSSNTSDGLPIQGPITAELCREVGPRPETPAARLKACAPVRRLAVTPGGSSTSDDLTPALAADPVTLLTYRVQLFNAAGRSAGESAVAGFAAAGAAPPVIEDLHASNLEAGAVLEWKSAATPGIVDLERTALSGPAALTPPAAHGHSAKPRPAPAPATVAGKAGKNKKSKKTKGKTAQSTHPAASHSDKSTAAQTAEVHLRATEPTASGHASQLSATGSSAGTPETQEGTVDLTAQMGSTYRYVAGRVRTVKIGIHTLEIESALSPAVNFAHLDIFPPQRPTGLEAIPGSDPQNPAAIDLSWEPNGEVDLAGYLVYRQSLDAHGAANGPAVQLTPSPVATPAFRDLSAVSGQSYAYQVLAVDQAGNQSPLSDRVLQLAAAH
jgi:hypothetical protein